MEICGSFCSLTLFGLNSLLFFLAVCFHWIICPPIHLSVSFVHSKNTRTIDGNNWCSRFVYRKWVNHKRKWMQQNIYKTKWIFVCGLYIWIYLVSFSTYTHSTTTTQLTCVIEDSPEPPAYIFWNHNNAVSINTCDVPFDRTHMALNFLCIFPPVAFVINFRTFSPSFFSLHKETIFLQSICNFGKKIYREITHGRCFDFFFTKQRK